jgi:hypothetical protein
MTSLGGADSADSLELHAVRTTAAMAAPMHTAMARFMLLLE